MYQEAMKWLDALSDGQAIFALTDTQRAGLPHTERITSTDLHTLTPTRVTNNSRSWGVRNSYKGYHGNSSYDYY
jgi:hypothetical protein